MKQEDGLIKRFLIPNPVLFQLTTATNDSANEHAVDVSVYGGGGLLLGSSQSSWLLALGKALL